jgi:hypothetical protein
MTQEKNGFQKGISSQKKIWVPEKFDRGAIFDGPIEGAATMPSAELDMTRTRLRSTYTTDAAYPVTFMQHENAANPHLARPQYGERVSPPASLLCMGLFLRKFVAGSGPGARLRKRKQRKG